MLLADMLNMRKSPVTATSRLLKKMPGVPVVRKVIAVKADGTVKTVINRPA
jgi:hypothetical protein